jgi:hypothetical protein
MSTNIIRLLKQGSNNVFANGISIMWLMADDFTALYLQKDLRFADSLLF